MTIDFAAPQNAETYSGREAQPDWGAAILRLAGDPGGLRVADIGCGGGTYCRAWARLGAARVFGIDASAPIAASAARDCAGEPRIAIRRGHAEATGLAGASVDIVFSRAVIHHLPDLAAAFREAARILAPGGRLIVQDRTLDDVLAPPSPEHIRGCFFRAVPRLRGIEAKRRPDSATLLDAMRAAGFEASQAVTVWETRAHYASRDALLDDLRARRGRSILHVLDESELKALLHEVAAHVPPGPVCERDRWTLWSVLKPA